MSLVGLLNGNHWKEFALFSEFELKWGFLW